MDLVDHQSDFKLWLDLVFLSFYLWLNCFFGVKSLRILFIYLFYNTAMYGNNQFTAALRALSVFPHHQDR